MPLSLQAGLAEKPKAGLSPLLATAWRYGLSTAGPVATSAAHFLASLLFVRNLPATAFGLFSFVLVIVPFAMSLAVALLVVPVTRALDQPREIRDAVVASCLKMNLILCSLTALCIFALLLWARAEALPALLLGLFGGVFTFRWFARCHGFVEGRAGAAIASDMVYATALACGLGVLAATRHVTLNGGAVVLLLAALAALAPLGPAFFAAQFAALFSGRLDVYRATFRDMTRWSLLGVVFTEITVNAHAYLVTFMAGPESFALLALGMLLMRPASLVQGALPDLERPVMTRQIAARDWGALRRTARVFGAGLFMVLLATMLLDAVLLVWFPGLVLKRGYGMRDVMTVAALCALIMTVRCFRTPPAIVLQAAGAFKEMAGIGIRTSAISLLATLALLLAFGPIASLGGVLLGELMTLIYCRRLVAAWETCRV